MDESRIRSLLESVGLSPYISSTAVAHSRRGAVDVITLFNSGPEHMKPVWKYAVYLFSGGQRSTQAGADTLEEAISLHMGWVTSGGAA